MSRWFRPLLVPLLFAPVALMAGLMGAEAIPTTKGWITSHVTLRAMWVAGTVFCLACLALIYQNETTQM